MLSVKQFNCMCDGMGMYYYAWLDRVHLATIFTTQEDRMYGGYVDCYPHGCDDLRDAYNVVSVTWDGVRTLDNMVSELQQRLWAHA